MNTHCLNHGFWLVLAVMAWMPPVHAADEAMARAQFMIRQISAERDQLQADRAAMQKKLDELQKKFDSLETSSSKKSGDMKEQFAQLRELYDSERKAHEETRATLATVISEKNSLADVGSRQEQNIDLCIANNHKLYEINRKLLQSYENKGVWDSMVQAEPFTGMSQVEIENLVDDTQYQLEDLRIKANLVTVDKVN